MRDERENVRAISQPGPFKFRAGKTRAPAVML